MPATPRTWPGRRAFLRSHFAGHARHFRREAVDSWSTIVFTVFFQLRGFRRFDVTVIFFDEVAVGDGGLGHGGDVSRLRGEVAGHHVHAVGQVFPRTSDTALLSNCPPSFPSVPTSRATRVTLAREAGELVHHRVDDVLHFGDFTLHVHGDLLGEVARGDGGRHCGNITNLTASGCRPSGLRDVVGQVLQRTGDAPSLRPARPASLPCPLRGQRASPDAKASKAGPPSC